MQTEPTYIEQSYIIGDGVTVHFKGENYGRGFADTAVKIGDVQLCWIPWSEKELFLQELRNIVDKYRI